MQQQTPAARTAAAAAAAVALLLPPTHSSIQFKTKEVFPPPQTNSQKLPCLAAATATAAAVAAAAAAAAFTAGDSAAGVAAAVLATAVADAAAGLVFCCHQGRCGCFLFAAAAARLQQQRLSEAAKAVNEALRQLA